MYGTVEAFFEFEDIGNEEVLEQNNQQNEKNLIETPKEVVKPEEPPIEVVIQEVATKEVSARTTKAAATKEETTKESAETTKEEATKDSTETTKEEATKESAVTTKEVTTKATEKAAATKEVSAKKASTTKKESTTKEKATAEETTTETATETEETTIEEIITTEVETTEVSTMLDHNVSKENNAFHLFGVIIGIIAILAFIAGGGIILLKQSRKKAIKLSKAKRNAAKKKIAEAKAETLTANTEIRMGTASDIGARESQQDNYCISRKGESDVLAVVADGMGGLKNGAEVSGIVTYIFKDSYEHNVFSREKTENELMQILMEANREACEYIEKNGGEMSGSTVVAVRVSDDKLYFVSVGDSHIYLRRDEKLLQLNHDHIYAFDLDEKVVRGEINLDQALNHPERKCLTSYVGMGEIEHVDRNLDAISVGRGDKVLLVSDGVYGTLSKEEINRIMMMDDPQQIADSLIDRVLMKQKRGQDNATAVVVSIN